MASAQVDAEFNDKQKAAIEKAMQEAQNTLANNKDEQYQLVAVGGVMQNSQHRPIRLLKTHNAQGEFVTSPPEAIGGDAHGAFVHQGATSQGQLQVIVGSKCAIVFGTFDRSFPGLGYLLAWYKPDNSDEINKVYVKAGDPYKLERMEWSEIEPKLDASNNESTFVDPETGAAATAVIKDNGNKRALIASSFDRVLPKA